MCRGLAWSSSIFARSRLTCTSSVLVSLMWSDPHTRSMSCIRLSTWSAFRSSTSSSWNSFSGNRIWSPRRLTACLSTPIRIGPASSVSAGNSSRSGRTGRKPLLAGGNANGDAAMLRTARFGLLIRHDDAGREFAYDSGAEKALAKAQEAAGRSSACKTTSRWCSTCERRARALLLPPP